MFNLYAMIKLLLVLLWSALVYCASPSALEHTNNWAVIVSTSRFWFNYRHTSNALAIYRTVKQLGMPDSHIIVMLAEEMGCNPRNNFAGTVYSNAGRALDLYSDDIQVDYKGEEVSVESFLQVLTNRVPENTPANKRLLSDANSNILLYMTGHGGNEFLKFQDCEEMTSVDLADAVDQMHAARRYKNILFLTDTCQAATLANAIRSPNVLASGSSQKAENSYSHHADADIGVSVIDRYTHYVLNYINSFPGATLQDLFSSLTYDQIHSHPSVDTQRFKYPLDQVRISDFFGSNPQVDVMTASDESESGSGRGRTLLAQNVLETENDLQAHNASVSRQHGLSQKVQATPQSQTTPEPLNMVASNPAHTLLISVFVFVHLVLAFTCFR